jgi:transcriptional regulator with XRE-family HTH domain
MDVSQDARRPPARDPESTDAMFGARLRMERERRRITLASIAANTKIGLYLLEGLERGHVTRWPSGIFRRSFIRAYAEAIGLDPDDVAREFLERFPDPSDMPFEPAVPDARRTPAGEPVLRLNLADLETTTARGRLLLNMRPRWAAAC